MIRWCASIMIWRWCGPHSSSWSMARWTTAEPTCSIWSAPTVNGSLQASPIPDGRIVRPSDPTLFFKFAFFWRVGGAFEFEAIAVGVGERDNPQAVSDEWALARLYSAGLEFAIERQRVFAHEAD